MLGQPHCSRSVRSQQQLPLLRQGRHPRSYLFCVVEPPEITEKPDVIKVTVGDPVSLDCKVTGSPELKVKWMKGGKELQSIRQHKLVFENNISSLKIQAAEREDEGEYILEVANHISHTSCKVKLIVLGWWESCANSSTDMGKTRRPNV